MTFRDSVSLKKDGLTVTIARKFREVWRSEWPGWTKMLIWIILVTPLTVQAVRELVSNQSEYKYNNIASQMEVVSSNESVERPALTVCFPYYSGSLDRMVEWVLNDEQLRTLSGGAVSSTNCPECEGMKNNSWDVWREIEWPLGSPGLDPNLPSTLTNALISKLLKNGGDFSALILNESNFNWNQPIVDAVWMFLSCMFKQDRDSITGGNEISWELDCDNYRFIDVGSIPDATIDRLFKLVLDAASVYGNFSYESAPGIWSNDSVRDISGFVPFGAKFCFPCPPSLAVRFEYKNFPSHQAFDPPWLRPTAAAQAWKATRRLEFYKGDSMYSYSLTEDYSLPLATLNADNSGYHHLALAYTVEKQIDARRPDRTCSDESADICLAKRRFNRVTDQCRCVPFSLRHLRPASIDSPYCNKTSYESCDEERLKEQDKIDLEFCNDKCDYIFYKWDHASRFVAKDGYLNFGIMVHAARLPFIKSFFVHKITFEQFLAQVGGTLGLYLGLSGLTLLTLFIFIIDMIGRCRQRGESSTAASNRWNLAINLPILLTSLAVPLRGSDDGKKSTSAETKIQTCGTEVSKSVEETRMNELESQLRKVLLQLDNLQQQLDSQGHKAGIQPVDDDAVERDGCTRHGDFIMNV